LCALIGVVAAVIGVKHLYRRGRHLAAQAALDEEQIAG
jgi:hypothetical protein